MSLVRALLARLFVVVGLAFPSLPRVIVLLDVLQQRSVARVLLTRRRTLTYDEFFTLRDREGRRAAPVARAATSVGQQNSMQPIDDIASDRYIRVRAA